MMAGASQGSGATAEPADRRAVVQPIIRFLVASALGVALLALVYVAFVLTQAGQQLENLALEGAAYRDPAEVEGSLAGLSQISILSYGIAIGAVIAIGLARRRPGLALTSAAVMGVSIVSAEILKELLPRPHLVEGPAWLLSNTFPSGHATIAASIGIGALLVAPGRLRSIVLPVAATYAAVIAQAVQIAGWHRLSGTLGGVLLATVVACVALAILAAGGYVQISSEGRVHRHVRRGLLVVSAVMLVLSALVWLLATLFPTLHAPQGADSAFAHTALDLLGVGFTMLVVIGFAATIEPYTLGRVAVVQAKDSGSEASGEPVRRSG